MTQGRDMTLQLVSITSSHSHRCFHIKASIVDNITKNWGNDRKYSSCEELELTGTRALSQAWPLYLRVHFEGAQVPEERRQGSNYCVLRAGDGASIVLVNIFHQGFFEDASTFRKHLNDVVPREPADVVSLHTIRRSLIWDSMDVCISAEGANDSSCGAYSHTSCSS